MPFSMNCNHIYYDDFKLRFIVMTKKSTINTNIVLTDIGWAGRNRTIAQRSQRTTGTTLYPGTFCHTSYSAKI
jgi:hypothetical protein